MVGCFRFKDLDKVHSLNFKKIIFISYIIKPDYFEKRYCIYDLIAKGFEIEYWDLSLIFGIENDETGDSDHVIKFKSRTNVKESIKNNVFSSFVLLIHLEHRFFWIYRLLTKYHCKLFFFSWGEFPPPRISKFQSLKNSLQWYLVNRR